MCPKLQVLVFGCNWDVPLEVNLDDEVHVPRHCFIRGTQTDALGRKVVVGVQSPISMIRELDPSLDILESDPECEWLGAKPGRFYAID